MTDLLPGKRPCSHWLRRLGGPQHWSGWVWKISPPVGYDPHTVQPVARRYVDYAIPAHYFTFLMMWKKGHEICHRLHSLSSETFKTVACYSRGVHIFQNSRSHLRILGARRVIWIKFLPENLQDVRCHCTTFSCHGNLTHGKCAPLC